MAQIVSVTEGDTFKVSVKGQTDTVRMYHMNSPETHSPQEGIECGGDSTTKEGRSIPTTLAPMPTSTLATSSANTSGPPHERRA